MIVNIDEFVKEKIEDEIIIFETDTVYGIGCCLSNIEGVKRIYEIKNRDNSKPMAILCSNLEEVKKLVINFEDGYELADKYWPGELTLIFKKSYLVSDLITSGLDTVGIRIPNNDICKKILEKNGPMVVTSLNQSNEPSIYQFSDVLRYDKIVDKIIKGGDLLGISSTVYDIMNKKVLRQGNVTIDV